VAIKNIIDMELAASASPPCPTGGR